MSEFDKMAQSWFLEFLNDWLTWDAFASAKGVELDLACAMVEHGKKIHEVLTTPSES